MLILTIISTTTVSIYVRCQTIIYTGVIEKFVLDLGERHAYAKSIFNRQRNYPTLYSVRYEILLKQSTMFNTLQKGKQPASLTIRNRLKF